MARTAIINALVFDGYSLHKDLTVTIENELITSIESSSSAKTFNSNIIDGKGSTLLPGFIDCHVHLDPNPERGTALLAQLAEAGVTTALDMGYLPGAVRDSFRSSSPIGLSFCWEISYLSLFHGVSNFKRYSILHYSI
jgi:imidazolonepropionase-like amidohydrolase